MRSTFFPACASPTLLKEQNHYIKIKYYIWPIGIRTRILIGLFSSKIFNYFIFTQNYSLCPKGYRGKKNKVKNRSDFFACDIGGGVWK